MFVTLRCAVSNFIFRDYSTLCTPMLFLFQFYTYTYTAAPPKQLRALASHKVGRGTGSQQAYRMATLSPNLLKSSFIYYAMKKYHAVKLRHKLTA